VIGLSGDPLDDTKALAAKLGLDFPILSDAERTAMQAYGVEDPANSTAWPALFVIGADGVIREQRILETYKERPLVATIVGALEPAPAPQ
jgi:peroxiredoxin